MTTFNASYIFIVASIVICLSLKVGLFTAYGPIVAHN
jgi:hypothetical protein